jgi:hypothetical protein
MKKSLLTALTLTLAALALPAPAQNPAPTVPGPNGAPGAPGANGQPGGDQGRRRFNPEEFRKQIAERLKTDLKVTDEEWTVLQPMIEKVTNAQRASFGGGRGFRPPGGGGGGGNTGGGGTTATSDRPGAAEASALRETLANESAPKEEIQAKMGAVRAQRKQAQADLEAAREELKKVVTLRQEAVLVGMGILD